MTRHLVNSRFIRADSPGSSFTAVTGAFDDGFREFSDETRILGHRENLLRVLLDMRSGRLLTV